MTVKEVGEEEEKNRREEEGRWEDQILAASFTAGDLTPTTQTQERAC